MTNRDYHAEREATKAAERAKYDADMADMPALKAGEWKWWASADGERYSVSAETRDGAIAAYHHPEDGFYITEARHGSELDLAKVFDLERFFEEVDDHFEDFQSEDFDGFMSDYSRDELADLETRVRQAIRRWQVETREKSGHAARPWCFAESRNEEHFPAVEGGEA